MVEGEYGISVFGHDPNWVKFRFGVHNTFITRRKLSDDVRNASNMLLLQEDY
jgi:hypothetical protein